MSVPYITPEQRRREHEEILAFIAKENAAKVQQTIEEERDEFDEWLENLSPDELPEFMRPKPKPEEILKASDFADKSVSPFTHGNKYNYQININHPAIAPVFQQYVRDECKSSPPISDHERIMFEMRVIHKLDSLGIFKQDYERPMTDEEIRDLKYQAMFDAEKRAERTMWKEMSNR